MQLSARERKMKNKGQADDLLPPMLSSQQI